MVLSRILLALSSSWCCQYFFFANFISSQVWIHEEQFTHVPRNYLNVGHFDSRWATPFFPAQPGSANLADYLSCPGRWPIVFKNGVYHLKRYFDSGGTDLRTYSALGLYAMSRNKKTIFQLAFLSILLYVVSIFLAICDHLNLF